MTFLTDSQSRFEKINSGFTRSVKGIYGQHKRRAGGTGCSCYVITGAGEYEEKFKKNNLDLIIKNDVTPVMIQADGRHLWRVFDNLMNNINKYAQPGTRVYIDIIPKDRGAIITFKNVSATPLNISSDELKERFVRGDSSRNTEGSGLGLSIVRKSHEAHEWYFGADCGWRSV